MPLRLVPRLLRTAVPQHDPFSNVLVDHLSLAAFSPSLRQEHPDVWGGLHYNCLGMPRVLYR